MSAHPGFRLLLTLAIAAAGGALAALVGAPVPWLLGSVVSVAVSSLAGVRLHLPEWLRDTAFFILGLLAGSSVTPEVLDQVAVWPLSFFILFVGVVATAWLTTLFLERVLGWDRQTAFFASLPGALSFVLAAASQTKADMTRVVIVQSVRLLTLILLLAPLLAHFQDGEGVTASVYEASLLQYALFLASTLVCAWLCHRLRIPGGIILGALIGSAVMHGTEIAPVALPPLVEIFGFVVLGAFIGIRLRREDRKALRQLFPASIGAFFVGIAISVAAGLVAHFALGVDFGRLALAYAPGALEALTAIAYQFDIDPAYVAAHHVFRFVVLALSIPFLARWIAGARVSDVAADPPPKNGTVGE